MLAALVRTFVALHASFHRLPASASSTPGQESSPWFVGCVSASSLQLSAPEGACDPDPASCSVRCLDEGYQVAALSSRACYCGNQLHGLLVSGCFSTSSTQRTKDLTRGSEKQSALHLPRGNGQEGSVALYRTEGPFLQSISVSASPETVHAGRTFVLNIFGNLAAPPSQPTGIADFGEEELSYVTVEFLGMAPKGQRSCHVNVSHDGSFNISSDWVFKTPGQYEINVRVCSSLSALSSTLHLSVFQLPPDGLLILLLHGSLKVSSCTLLRNSGPSSVLVDVAYRGKAVTLQACVSEGPATSFQWWVTHKDKERFTKGLETECFSSSDCLHSMVNWTFNKEGVHSVSVNASSEFGWTQKTLYVVVLPPTVSGLGLSVSGGQPAGGEEVSVDVEVIATTKRLVLFKFTLEAECNHSCEIHADLSSAEKHCYHGVRIYVEKPVYPINTDIIFTAVADMPDNVEFLWDFGDSTSARSTSRTITKRYHNPGSYNVVVVASCGQISVTSDAFLLLVQTPVRLNRLLHQASVLRNQAVMFSCRVNVGTNVTFMWSFGDGTARTGQSTEQHVFHRTGEFRVKVSVSNLVSSASLSSHLFVVDRPCQPPPVKNMGPLKLQVRRDEVIRLGVAFETEVDCDVSGDLQYTWTLFDSAGQIFPLPLTDIDKQSLVLQSHLLHYDTYTAIAKVQIIGSVVYSNYMVKVLVMPSPPVAFIQGGTNVFIDGNTRNVVTLDGKASHDPDFLLNPLRYIWTCKPVSAISSSCFNQDIPTVMPVLKFPVSLLKHNFDQFRFTLTVHSGERSASSEIFLTLTSGLIGRMSIKCLQCQGDRVNWDQSFSVSAVCEDCKISAALIQYSWSLYLVNASSKPVVDVPFCYTVDLRAPSAIMEDPVTSPLPPESTTLYHPDANESRYTHTVAPLTLLENASTPETKSKRNFELGDHGEVSSRGRGLSGSEPSISPLVLGSSYSDDNGQSGFFTEFPDDPDSSTDWEFSFPLPENGDVNGRQSPDDYDVPFPSAEGDPGLSAGRLTVVDVHSYSPTTHKDEGSNLMVPKPPEVIQEPSLLDLHRDSVERGVFESYTYTGISSPLLRIRPFSLRPASRYMLEVTAKFQEKFFGRTQLFLKTSPVPKDVMCQVQPDKGMELETHFSIFCSSGREDLLYKYSLSIGGGPPRVLYQGRDFQYYFSLPSGDPSDDYKVTIYTEIRGGTDGSTTKPCPVSIQVKPSFLRSTSSSSAHQDPDLKLSESGLRNLSALMQLGNTAEIRNYISLLSSILNRLSLDTEANRRAQSHMRNVLICIVCKLESSEQVSVDNNLLILNELLQFPSQVTFASARQIAAHVRAVSEQFSESGAADWDQAEQRMLNMLVSLLSHTLQVVTSQDYTLEKPRRAGLKHSPKDCLPDPDSIGHHIIQEESIATKQIGQLVEDILQTASNVILNYILLHETEEFRVSTDLITLYAGSQNQTSSVISHGSTSFYMPASLIETLFHHHRGGAQRTQQRPCVCRVITELANSPYSWAKYPTQLSGPIVDLSLYKCSTKRKISVRFLVQPITAELQQAHRNKNPAGEHVLLRGQINYHNFTITQEHLQHAIQVTVVFSPPLNKAFPIMLLFRMFERPTPSMHHLWRIHRWLNNTTRISLHPSYLNAAGVGHLALLDADFGKVARRKPQSEQVSYSLTVESSLCLSWDGQQGVWTQHGCRTQQNDSTPAVTCSCHQLRPLTVLRQQIQSSHDKDDLDPFLSVSSDLTVLGVLLLCLCLYIPGLLWCKRADVTSEENQRVHYLSDNSPTDQYLYAVTVHTGLCSAACMSAKGPYCPVFEKPRWDVTFACVWNVGTSKDGLMFYTVYIVLQGEDGVSQTKELQVPGCSLFRRNCKDTFILSAADSLGSVWGVHIWHDNSGPSPDWYLNLVEVSEVNSGQVKGSAWLFVAQCWLAVDKGDGRVERMLRVRTCEIGFAKMLSLRLSDYLADFHIWISVYSCPCPNSFTHTQRLSVSLLLLAGYACINTVIISLMGDQLPFQSGIIGFSDVSITTGLLSVAAVLPAAAVVSLLFRFCGIKETGSGVQQASNIRLTKKDNYEDAFSLNDINDSPSEPHLSRNGLQQWAQEACTKKYQVAPHYLLSIWTIILEAKDGEEELILQPDTIARKTETLGQALQKPLLVSKWSKADQTPEGNQPVPLNDSSGFHGTPAAATVDLQSVQRERGVKLTSLWCRYLAWALCLLWTLSCLLLSAVLGMRFSSSKVLLWIHALFVSLTSCIFLIQPTVILAAAVVVSCWGKKSPDFHCLFSTIYSQTEILKLWSRNGADQSEKQLRPSALCQKTHSDLEKLGARQRARYLRLLRPPTRAELRKTRGQRRRDALIHKTLRDFFLCSAMLLLMAFMTSGSSPKDHYHLNRAIRRHFIRNHDNGFIAIKKHEDWWKWAQTSLLHFLYSNVTARTEQSFIMIGDPVVQKTSSFQSPVSMATLPRMCDAMGCSSDEDAPIGLGRTKSDAESKLRFLQSKGWLGGQTVALKVQFTLFSPALNLFSSVTLLTEQSHSGVLLPSAKVQSVKVYHTPAVWDYVVMVCQLLFLFLSLLQLCNQVSTATQQGLMGYWRMPCSWLEVSLMIMTLVYYVCHLHRSTMITGLVELLQRHNSRGRIDVSVLAAWEQLLCLVRAMILFLLTMKCVTIFRVNQTLALLWPAVSGLIVLVALSCLGNLLYTQGSWAFCSSPSSLHMLLCRYRGALSLSPAVWITMAIGGMSSLVRKAKRSQSRRNHLTVTEVLHFIRQKIPDFSGKHRQAKTDCYKEGQIYLLEEFESSVDELLFRLNALSNSLHHTLPPKAHRYSVASPTPEPSDVDTQNLVRSQLMVNNLTYASDQGESLLRSQFQQETPKVLPCRSQRTHNHPDISKTKKTKNCWASPESRSSKRFWKEDTSGSSCLNNTKAVHSGVVVEVLVHEEPGTSQLDVN